MTYDHEVTLIGEVYEKNAGGDMVPVPTPRPVMGDKQSVRQSEFYQAQQAGLRPEIMFVIATLEYQGERRLSYAGVEYKIIRTYDRPDEQTELLCEGPVKS